MRPFYKRWQRKTGSKFFYDGSAAPEPYPTILLQHPSAFGRPQNLEERSSLRSKRELHVISLSGFGRAERQPLSETPVSTPTSAPGSPPAPDPNPGTPAARQNAASITPAPDPRTIPRIAMLNDASQNISAPPCRRCGTRNGNRRINELGTDCGSPVYEMLDSVWGFEGLTGIRRPERVAVPRWTEAPPRYNDLL